MSCAESGGNNLALVLGRLCELVAVNATEAEDIAMYPSTYNLADLHTLVTAK